MGKSAGWILLAASLLCSSLVMSEDCPSECSCLKLAIDSTRVDCSNKGLTSIPKLPDTTTEVLMSGNQLDSISNSSFAMAPFLRRLDLSNNGLSSLDIGAFVNLGSLEYLDLSRNNLDAEDFRNHEVFRGCKYIKEINLSNNRLTSIPGYGLKILTKLTKLSMRDNSITNPVFGPEFVSLELLEDVDISGNRFDLVPSHTFQIVKSLKSVNISRCGIKRISAGLFSDVRTLHTFDASDNTGLNIDDLNSTIKAISQSPELSILRLANLNITDLAGMLAPLTDTDLKILDLSYNSLSVLHAADLRPPRKLRELNLSHNNLVNLTSLSLAYLQKLDLSHNRIGSISQRDLEGVPEVKELGLSYNRLTDFRSDPFSRNLFIETIDLSYNLISTVYEIQHLESLRILSLKGNIIRNPQNLFKLYRLEILDLSFNSIPSLTNDMIAERLDSLTTLNFSNNAIEYIQGDTFKRWSPAVIDLSYNKLASMEDWGLTLVKHLNLSNNQIQFVSEQALVNLDYLEHLDLSDNKLSIIPTSLLDHLDELRHLDLSNNNLAEFLQGQMGKAAFTVKLSSPILLEHLVLENNGLNHIQNGLFSDLSRLESLDLSHNKLKEVRSEQLQGLALLMTLDLSNNELTGFNTSAIKSLVSLKSIDLSGVKWTCDCSISDIKTWIESTNVEIHSYKDTGKYVCYVPQELKGKPLSALTLEDQNCSVTLMEKTIILIIIGCTSFVILVAAAIIFWQHRWRLKKKLKKQHYRAMYEGGQPQPQSNNGQMAQTYLHHHHHHHSPPHHQHTPTLPNKMTYSTDGHSSHNSHNGHAFV